MSLLLEALKKAALEKQNRAELPAEEPIAEAVDANDTLSHESEVVAIEEPDWNDLEFEEEFEEEPENLLFEEEPSAYGEPSANGEPSADIEPSAYGEPSANEEPSTDLDPSAEHNTESLIDEDFFAEPDPITATKPVEAEIDDDFLSAAEQEAAQQLEQQRKALQAQEVELLAQQDEARQQLEQQEQQREAELQEQAVKEQQLRDQQFEEQERRDQEQREAEAQRQQDEQQAISAQRDRQALDQLITSGKTVEKRSRRRAGFLYVMLVVTAAGGILSYWFYLSARGNMAELQTQAPVGLDEPPINIEEIIQSGEIAANNTTSLEPESSLDIEATIDSAPLESTLNQAQSESTLSGTTQTAPLVADRVDPPPSATEYLRPLVTSERSGQQTESIAERVILHHEPKTDEVTGLIQRAFSAMKQQQHEQAQRLYDQALAIDPNHRDALLGSAASASAQGDFSRATSLYQQRLSLNPTDQYARAGLLGLMNSGESRGAVQREISSMLEANPTSAHLHFLKGVGLAANRQWQPAQSAFYEAFRINNQNPDYAFNLAVSLDHLKQRPLARVYYERALSLSEQHAANFNQLAANRRLTELTKGPDDEQ